MKKSSAAVKKGKPEPSQSDLEQWIAHTGFPLEMRCATILERVGFHEVVIGQHFVDPSQPDVLHEIDVVGTLRFPLPNGFEAVIRVVCECKYSKGRPWVSLTWHRPLDTSNPYSHTLGTPPAKRFFAATLASLPGSQTLPSSIPLAYHVVQFQDSIPTESGARSSQRDSAYLAVEQVTRAGQARVNSIIAAMGVGTTIFEVVIPTIVLDGSLYIGEVGANGGLKLIPAKASLLLRERLDEGGVRVPVQLITVQNFEEWSAGLRLIWMGLAQEHSQEILASLVPVPKKG
jgi:hypothetical protein